MDFPIAVKPNETLQIKLRSSVQQFVVQPDPLDSEDPYFELGGTGAVLKLQNVQTQASWALKIFDPPYRDEGQVHYVKNLQEQRLENLLLVADRIVITPEEHSELLEKHDALKYSLLMPWIPGYTWQEVLISNKNGQKSPAPSAIQAFETAANLCVLLKVLEDKNCAHCDICSNNVIVDPKRRRVELIDIEDMYGPGFQRNPTFIGGQKGYTHQKHGQEHQWCQESDRFGGAILIAEMMSWYSSDVRALSGEESYFISNDDLHKKTRAFYTLIDAIKEHGSNRLVDLFVGAWESSDFRECPPLSEWYEEIAKIAEQNNLQIEGLLTGTATPSEPLVKKRRVVSIDSGDSNGVDWVDTQDPGGTTIARRRVLSSDDDRDDDYVVPSSDIIRSRRKISHDTGTATPRAKVSVTTAPRKTPKPQHDFTSASSPKARVSKTGSSNNSGANSTSSNTGEILVNIFWTIVFLAIAIFVINAAFPELFPSVIEFIQDIVDSINAPQ